MPALLKCKIAGWFSSVQGSTQRYCESGICYSKPFVFGIRCSIKTIIAILFRKSASSLIAPHNTTAVGLTIAHYA